MCKHIRPAIVMIVCHDDPDGPGLSAGDDRHRAVVFPYQANGSLIEKDGKVDRLGPDRAEFHRRKYFHGRPSATTETDPKDATKTVAAPYNADNSAGSNLGPTSKALVDRVKDDAEKLAAENPTRRCRSTW